MTMVTMVINASNSAVFKHVQAQAPDVIFDCNVLCSTNLVGLLTLPIWFRRDLTPDKLRAVGCRRWLALLVGTLLFQVVGPFFFLKGLAGTSVAQAAVLARLDQVEFYVFALCLLGEKLNAWDAAANALTLLAVVLTLTVAPLFGTPIALDSSSILVIVSTFGYSGSLLVSKKFLTKVPIGIVSVFRLLVGTLAFHLYVLAVGGRDGLSRLFAPELWQHMWWYGLVYVTLFQGLWLTVLARVPPPLISLGSSTRFPMTLAFGIAINRDMPSGSQWVGGAVMVLALGVGSVKVVRQLRQQRSAQTSTASDAEPSAVAEEEEPGEEPVAASAAVTTPA